MKSIESSVRVDTARSVFFQGVMDVWPVLFGVTPFGVVMGFVLADFGLNEIEAFIKSFAIFAGASQLVMLDLLGRGVALWVIILSASVINFRMVIFSAALGRSYSSLSLFWKVLLSYTLVDQVYALTNQYLEKHPASCAIHWYHVGTAAPIVLVWFGSLIAGYYAGAFVPASWSLSFVVPVMFLAFAIPAIKGVPTLAAAVTAAVVAVVANGLPNNLGLLVGAFSGIVVGMLLEREA